MRPSFPFLLVLAALLSAGAARAQGGPPFITDDPGTPGNRHWEINLGWIANHNPGQSYYEIPDVDLLQAINRVGDQPKQRSFTLDIGGRRSLDRANHVRLLFLAGRALQAVTPENGEPSWIAYLGLPFLLGPKEKEVPGQAP
jgi:hypothetical protein